MMQENLRPNRCIGNLFTAIEKEEFFTTKEAISELRRIFNDAGIEEVFSPFRDSTLDKDSVVWAMTETHPGFSTVVDVFAIEKATGRHSPGRGKNHRIYLK